MPRPSKGARLWFDAGADVWCILDGRTKRRLGLPRGERDAAEQRLAEWIAAKYGPRKDPAATLTVADVLAHYARAVAPGHAHPGVTSHYIDRLADWWGNRPLSDVGALTCRAYAEARLKDTNRRATRSAAPKPISVETVRRELSVLSAAIHAWHADSPLPALPVVTLPPKPPGRTRWLTRAEVARMLGACHTHPDRDAGRALARYILISLYTGTRSDAVRQLSWHPTTTGGWVDLEAGVIYRRGSAERETTKRRPPIRIPDRLAIHLKAWHAADLRRPTDAGPDWTPPLKVVHYKGAPVDKQRRAWAYVVTKAELGGDVVGHTLRHTAATWMMLQGLPPYDVADYLGMSLQMLMRVYGHHHPDYQRATAAAIGRRRKETE